MWAAPAAGRGPPPLPAIRPLTRGSAPCCLPSAGLHALRAAGVHPRCRSTTGCLARHLCALPPAGTATHATVPRPPLPARLPSASPLPLLRRRACAGRPLPRHHRRGQGREHDRGCQGKPYCCTNSDGPKCLLAVGPRAALPHDCTCCSVAVASLPSRVLTSMPLCPVRAPLPQKLPKKPAPARFGRKLTAAQKARATHLCIDCGYVSSCSRCCRCCVCCCCRRCCVQSQGCSAVRDCGCVHEVLPQGDYSMPWRAAGCFLAR